jgi:hypothetical protein
MTTLNNSLTTRGLSTKDNLNASTDPSSGNDSTQGYQVGSLWQNSTTGRIWMARGVSVAAAVWTMLEISDHPGYIAGNWYLPAGEAGAGLNTGTARAAGTIQCSAGFIKERVTLSALSAYVSTVSAGGNFQLAIYANSNNRPSGNALASTASMSTATSQPFSSPVSVQVEPGFYWFCASVDNATATIISRNANNNSLGSMIGSATLSNVIANQACISGVTVAGTFGTWPNMSGQTFTESVGSLAVVGFQVGSVP